MTAVAPIPNRSGLPLWSEEILLYIHLTVFSMDPVSTWTRSSIVFLCKPSALFQLPENQCNPTFKETLVNILLVKCFISVSVVSTSSWTLQRRTFLLPRDRHTVLLPTLTSTRLLTSYQRINTIHGGPKCFGS